MQFLLMFYYYREESDAERKREETADNVTDDNFMVTARENRKTNGDRFTFMRQVEVDLDERSKARLERERVAQNFRKYVIDKKC